MDIERIDGAICKVVRGVVPANCPRMENPIGSSVPGPVLTVNIPLNFDEGSHCGVVDAKCSQLEPSSPICSGCSLRPGVQVILQKNLN